MKPGKRKSKENDYPLSVYKTQWQENSSRIWQTGLDFALGFTWDSKHENPQPIVQLMGEPVTENASITVDDNRCLIIEIDLSNESCLVCTSMPGMYLHCKVNLRADGRTFTGEIRQLCSGAVHYKWKGKCEAANSNWLEVMNSWISFNYPQ